MLVNAAVDAVKQWRYIRSTSTGALFPCKLRECRFKLTNPNSKRMGPATRESRTASNCRDRR